MYNDGKTPYQLDLEIMSRNPVVVPKVGDKVKIKSMEWYEKWKDDIGNVDLPGSFFFSKRMAQYCGNTYRVIGSNEYYYTLEGCTSCWTCSMFEEVYPQILSLNLTDTAATISSCASSLDSAFTCLGSPVTGIGIADSTPIVSTGWSLGDYAKKGSSFIGHSTQASAALTEVLKKGPELQ